MILCRNNYKNKVHSTKPPHNKYCGGFFMARRNELIKIMESELPDRNAIRKGYRPSRRQARYYYDLINQHIFKNKLVPTRIKISRMRECWGYCDDCGSDSYDPKTLIRLTDKFPCLQFFIAVLAHEMIHQYQWEVEGPRRMTRGLRYRFGHGKSFFRWRAKFNKFGIPLTVYGDHHSVIRDRDIWSL